MIRKLTSFGGLAFAMGRKGQTLRAPALGETWRRVNVMPVVSFGLLQRNHFAFSDQKNNKDNDEDKKKKDDSPKEEEQGKDKKF